MTCAVHTRREFQLVAINFGTFAAFFPLFAAYFLVTIVSTSSPPTGRTIIQFRQPKVRVGFLVVPVHTLLFVCKCRYVWRVKRLAEVATCPHSAVVVDKFFGVDMENVFLEGVVILVMVLLALGRVPDGALSLKSSGPIHSTVFVVEDYVGGSAICNQNSLVSALLEKKRASFDFQNSNPSQLEFP